MPDELPLAVGSRCDLLLHPSSHSTTVIRATPRSFVADYEDDSSPGRHFQRE
jgi:hypothetical protein